MKKQQRPLFTMLVILILLATALAACGGDDKKDSPEPSTQSFFDDGLSVELPGGWEADATEGGQVMLYSDSSIASAQSADDLPDNAAFGTIMVSQVYDFQLEEGPEGSLRSYLELEGGLPDDVEAETLEINGNPAARISYPEEQNGLQGYNYDVAVYYDDTVQVFVLLIGLDGDQSSFDSTFEGIVNSVTVDVAALSAQFETE